MGKIKYDIAAKVKTGTGYKVITAESDIDDPDRIFGLALDQSQKGIVEALVRGEENANSGFTYYTPHAIVSIQVTRRADADEVEEGSDSPLLSDPIASYSHEHLVSGDDAGPVILNLPTAARRSD